MRTSSSTTISYNRSEGSRGYAAGPSLLRSSGTQSFPMPNSEFLIHFSHLLRFGLPPPLPPFRRSKASFAFR